MDEKQLEGQEPEPKYEIRLDKEALKEYNELDNSVIDTVDKAIEELVYRADEVGKILTNKHATKLHGCKEIKLRKAGVRIVFRITNEVIDILRIVYILTIEKREDDIVFRIANKRYQRLLTLKKEKLKNHLERSSAWKRRRSRT